MSHWLDDAARGMTEGRYSRRGVLARGGRVAIGAALSPVVVEQLTRQPPVRPNANQRHVSRTTSFRRRLRALNSNPTLPTTELHVRTGHAAPTSVAVRRRRVCTPTRRSRVR